MGSTDCKAGVAALLWLAPRVRPKVRTVFSFTVCEEGIGQRKQNGSRRMAAMGGQWAITAEPTCFAEGPAVSLGTQGHARAVIRFAGKAAHSSRPDLGENAVLAAARFCLALEALHASFQEHEVYPGVRARPAVAPTIIRGGKISNAIPDLCEVTVSRRLGPGETRETFKSELDRLLTGAKATYELYGDGPCAVVNLKGLLFAAAQEAIVEVTGQKRFTFQRGRTDAVIYAGRGMDTITIGPGLVGQSHCANEHVNLKVAADCVRVLEILINRLQ
ncbi:MAG: M20 family metallopeptidase [Kiritimatiellia bacterium]